MAVFAVLTDDSVTDVLLEASKKLRSEDFVKNPFRGGVLTFRKENEVLSVLVMDPLYPSFYLAGLFFVGLYLVWPSWWLLTPAIIILSTGVVWSPVFLYVMLYVGLRKKGYRGKIRYTMLSEAWRWALGAERDR